MFTQGRLGTARLDFPLAMLPVRDRREVLLIQQYACVVHPSRQRGGLKDSWEVMDGVFWLVREGMDVMRRQESYYNCT